MATVVSQHVHHLGRHLRFFKTATNFTGISRKHVFIGSNRKTIENRVKKKEFRKIFPKILKLSISNFNFNN